LLEIQPFPVVELNRPAGIAMYEGPEHGLYLIDDLLAHGHLSHYHLTHSARADMCRRLGRIPKARVSYEKALGLLVPDQGRQEPGHGFLARDSGIEIKKFVSAVDFLCAQRLIG
jgi:RNA polymerase sigma-70 factor (ECF subfamily)